MVSSLDLLILVAFLAVVAGISIWVSRGEGTRAAYFLAGRGLGPWLIGLSLIASNISTEHFVGMTGRAAQSGFAVAVYEWLAAPALVFVAWWLLPRFLRAGIYTVPEFLEYRFDRGCRSLLAALMVIFFVLTVLATVLYSGATFLSGILDLPSRLESRFGLSPEAAREWSFQIGVWGIGIAAGVYTVLGGLKAVVWSDLLQGSALLIGGAVVSWLALDAYADGAGAWAGWRAFREAEADRFHLIRSWNDPQIPSLSLVTGLWIPVMFYWGLNQFITQRTLAAGSLARGQGGILIAAALKLALPFIVVLPGMVGVELLGEKLDPEHTDGVYPLLLRELLPSGLLGLMLAAVAGAVMSTFNSGLNSAATVFTLDLWGVHVRPDMAEGDAVRVGRRVTALLAVAACLWAPVIHFFSGVFDYIQELWGFVSAPTCAVFFIGLLRPRVPAGAARTALIAGPLVYLASRAPSWIWKGEAVVAGLPAPLRALHAYSSMAFLYHMFAIFIALCLMMLVWERRRPLTAAVVLPDRAAVDLAPLPRVRLAGFAVLVATLGLVLLFW
ncbi:MAG: solute:sodium symporter family transporter [Planctomycetota bacterium]